jgi:hypothetical protein
MWILNLVTVCTKIAKYILKKNRTFLIIWGASRFKTGFIKKKNCPPCVQSLEPVVLVFPVLAAEP